MERCLEEIDDIDIFSTDNLQHVKAIEKDLAPLRQVEWTPNLAKC